MNDLLFEFDLPPTNLVIFTSRNGFNWVPIHTIDYSSKFSNVTKAPEYLMVSNKLTPEANILLKFIKLKMTNTLNMKYSILFTKVIVYNLDYTK